MRIIPNSYGAERGALLEFNPCHEPGGTPKGGQFASKGACGAGVPAGWKVEQNAGGRWEVTSPSGWKAVVDTQDEALRHAERGRKEKSQLRRERLQQAEDQPLPYEPPLGGKPPADPLASDREMIDRLTSGTITDEEDLGGGINGSYKITLDDGTEAVWKPESGESWTQGDVRGDDEGEDFYLDEDAQQEAIDRALEDGHAEAERAYVKEARKQFDNELLPIYHAVLEEYSRAGKIQIRPGDDLGGPTLNTVLDALLGEEGDPDRSLFTEEGLVGDGAESVIRQMIDGLIADGVMNLPQELPTPDADVFAARSKYFNKDDGFPNWQETDEARQIADRAAERNEEEQRDAWMEAQDEAGDQPIRETITNRSFTQAERDRAAYVLDRTLGLGTTPVVTIREHNGERGSVMAYVNDTGGPADDDSMHRAAVLDFLIGNTDRHGNNYMIERGKIRTIDNGLSFPDGKSEIRSMIVRSVVNRAAPMTEGLRQDLVGRLTRVDWPAWIDQHAAGMSDDEREGFLNRATLLTNGLSAGKNFSEIAKAYKTYWWQ